MAKKKVVLTVCDSCGKDRETQTWTVTSGSGRRYRGDLCPECGRPLEKLLESAFREVQPRGTDAITYKPL